MNDSSIGIPLVGKRNQTIARHRGRRLRPAGRFRLKHVEHDNPTYHQVAIGRHNEMRTLLEDGVKYASA